MTAAYVDRRFETADGLRLEYRDYAPEGAAGGTPVLCLHGLTRNVRDFEELAPRIARLGRRVIVASQRGRGGSDFDPQPERYSPAVYTADMLALLDSLGVRRAVWIGTSMGGLMTMMAAATAPERLAGAVLNDIGPELDPAGLERIRGYVGGPATASTWEDAAELCRRMNGPAFPDERAASFWLTFARRLFREEAPGRIVLDYDPAISRTVREGSPDIADLWPLFEALRGTPCLLVRGEVSDILQASTVDRMRRRKPDLQTVTVPRVGHAPFLTEPEAWPALQSFLLQPS
jgi:pimeloyl-ACP methyl ester carboxylesterase